MSASRASRRFRIALGAILAAAAALRLAHWGAVRDAPFVASLALDSAEYDRWARAIADGDWLGSEPFFQAPLYPYLLGALYATFGRALDVVYLAQIAAGIGGLLFVALAARRALSEAHALAAASLGALYLPLVFHEVQIAKEGFAVAAASALVWALVVARDRIGSGRELRAWLGAGALLGVLALLRENALLLLPFLLPLTVRRDAVRASSARACAFAVGLVLVLLPVAVRNASLGGGFLPTTSQGGANFWIGNNPEADGTYRPIVPGKQIPALERAESQRLAEQALGRPLGAAEASRYWAGRALSWAVHDPLAFVRLQLRKVALYFAPYEWPDVVDYAWMRSLSPALRIPGVEWGTLVLLALAGLVFARRGVPAPGSWSRLAPVWLFEAGWLLATIAFFLFSRYRLPAIPGLLVAGSIPLVALVDSWQQGRRWRAAVGATLLLAVIVAVRITAPPPRSALVEFNLGRLSEEAGDAGAAKEHYERSLASEPTFFSAAMNLGTLAARAGHYDEAVSQYKRASSLEPRSDDAWANLGGAYLALGQLAPARVALARALELHPDHPAAKANLELLEKIEARRR